MTASLAATLLVLAATVAPAPKIPIHPGDVVELSVVGPDLLPVPGLTVVLYLVKDGEVQPGPGRCVGVTESPATRFFLPSPGRYVLELTGSGFLKARFGPFAVCPQEESSCGPVLSNPVKVMVPFSAFVDGVVVKE